MTSKFVLEKANDIEKATGKKLITIEETARYFGIGIDDIKTLISDGEIKTINSKIELIKTVDIARFELGVGNDSIVDITTNETLVNSHLDNSLTAALPYLQILTEEVNKEDFNMIVKEHGEGSVYWNNKRECFQMAFYLEVNGERKRKVVSGKSESEVGQKAAVAKAVANGSVTQTASPSSPLIIVQEAQEKLIVRKTVNEVAGEWLASIACAVTCSTLGWYGHMVKHMTIPLGDHVISELQPKDVQGFINSVAYPEGQGGKVMSEKTVKGAKLVMNMIFKYAIKNGYLEKNPAEDIKMPKTRKTDRDSRFLSQNQVSQVLKATQGNKKYSTLVMLLVSTGLRIGEALALEWTDIDYGLHRINVKHALTLTNQAQRYNIGDTKTQGSVRTIPISSRVEEVLTQWKKYIYADEKLVKKINDNHMERFVFVNDEGKLFNYQTLQSHFQQYLKRHSCEDLHCTFHMLRHSYGSFLLEKKVDLATVSRLLGHRSIKITADIYCTITDKVKLQAMEIIGEIMDDINDQV